MTVRTGEVLRSSPRPAGLSGPPALQRSRRHGWDTMCTTRPSRHSAPLRSPNNPSLDGYEFCSFHHANGCKSGVHVQELGMAHPAHFLALRSGAPHFIVRDVTEGRNGNGVRDEGPRQRMPGPFCLRREGGVGARALGSRRSHLARSAAWASPCITPWRWNRCLSVAAIRSALASLRRE